MRGIDDQQMQAVILQMSKDMATIQSELKATWKWIDEQKQLVESVQTLALSVRDLTNAQKNNTDAIATLQRDVDELKGKPAKRWESVVGVVITAIVTAVVTYGLTAAGLKK